MREGAAAEAVGDGRRQAPARAPLDGPVAGPRGQSEGVDATRPRGEERPAKLASSAFSRQCSAVIVDPGTAIRASAPLLSSSSAPARFPAFAARVSGVVPRRKPGARAKRWRSAPTSMRARTISRGTLRPTARESGGMSPTSISAACSLDVHSHRPFTPCPKPRNVFTFSVSPSRIAENNWQLPTSDESAGRTYLLADRRSAARLRASSTGVTAKRGSLGAMEQRGVVGASAGLVGTAVATPATLHAFLCSGHAAR